FEFGLTHGLSDFVREAIERLSRGLNAASEASQISMWWLTRLTRFLVDDLWAHSYYQRLPDSPQLGDDWSRLRRQFIHLMASKDLAHVEFWPSQLAAASRAVDQEDDLVVALPTSSGKTRIAEICI